MKSAVVIYIIFSFHLGCVSLLGQQNGHLLYDLDSPSEVHLLPDYLEEVSGLTFYQTNQLAMLNDEHGRMYVYDLDSKKIVHRVRFEKNGDFEGIERVGEFIYAIKSNGKLFRFKINMEGVVEEIDTPFHSENDVEGLGYDKAHHRLLVALKEKGDVKKVQVKGKAIYSLNLRSQTFGTTPAFVVSSKDLERVVGEKFKFKPSGVAVHPHSGETYVLSATHRALLVFGQDGKPKHLTTLKRSIFRQPEGIAFSPSGDLYIANEADGDQASIVVFRKR